MNLMLRIFTVRLDTQKLISAPVHRIKLKTTQKPRSAHSVRPVRHCVRPEDSQSQKMAHTKQRHQEHRSFQMNQLSNAIIRQWQRPCEDCQEALHLLQFLLTLSVHLVVPEKNNRALLKFRVLLVVSEVEVNLEIGSPEKPAHAWRQ
jgi:hypothetical protein